MSLNEFLPELTKPWFGFHQAVKDLVQVKPIKTPG